MSDSRVPQITGTTEGMDPLEEMDTQEAQDPTVSSPDQLGGGGLISESASDDETENKTKDPAELDGSGVPITTRSQDEVESQPIDSSGTKESAAGCSTESSEDPLSPQRSSQNEMTELSETFDKLSPSKTPTEDRVPLIPKKTVATRQLSSLMVASTEGETNAAFESDLPTGVAQTMQAETPAAGEVVATAAELPKPEPKKKKSSPFKSVGAKIKGWASPDKCSPGSECEGATSSPETTSPPTSPKASDCKTPIKEKLRSFKQKFKEFKSKISPSSEPGGCDMGTKPTSTPSSPEASGSMSPSKLAKLVLKVPSYVRGESSSGVQGDTAQSSRVADPPKDSRSPKKKGKSSKEPKSSPAKREQERPHHLPLPEFASAEEKEKHRRAKDRARQAILDKAGGYRDSPEHAAQYNAKHKAKFGADEDDILHFIDYSASKSPSDSRSPEKNKSSKEPKSSPAKGGQASSSRDTPERVQQYNTRHKAKYGEDDVMTIVCSRNQTDRNQPGPSREAAPPKDSRSSKKGKSSKEPKSSPEEPKCIWEQERHPYPPPLPANATAREIRIREARLHSWANQYRTSPQYAKDFNARHREKYGEDVDILVPVPLPSHPVCPCRSCKYSTNRPLPQVDGSQPGPSGLTRSAPQLVGKGAKKKTSSAEGGQKVPRRDRTFSFPTLRRKKDDETSPEDPRKTPKKKKRDGKKKEDKSRD